TRLHRLDWVRGLVGALERSEQFAQAKVLRREALEVLRAVYGSSDWRGVGGRPDMEGGRPLARLSLGPRRPLAEAAAPDDPVVGRWGAGRSKEALHLGERTLKLRRAALGEKHRLVALSLFNLGAQLEALQQFRRAEQAYRQALNVRQELLGEQHPQYADSLNN